MLPFMTCLRELSLFMLLYVRRASSSRQRWTTSTRWACTRSPARINLILIVTILIFNTLVNKLTGASLDEGIGGN